MKYAVNEQGQVTCDGEPMLVLAQAVWGDGAPSAAARDVAQQRAKDAFKALELIERLARMGFYAYPDGESFSDAQAEDALVVLNQMIENARKLAPDAVPGPYITTGHDLDGDGPWYAPGIGEVEAPQEDQP